MISEGEGDGQHTNQQEHGGHPKEPHAKPKNGWRRMRTGVSRASPFINAITAAVIAAATVTYTIYARRQWHTMRDQLEEMRVESAIRRSELRAVLTVTPQFPNLQTTAPTLVVTPHIHNAGKTDANMVRAWAGKKVFEANDHNFANALKSFGFNPSEEDFRKQSPTTTIAGDDRFLMSLEITKPEALGAAIGRNLIEVYGRIEYDDIFQVHTTIRCYLLNFKLSIGQITMTLPVAFPSYCNERTENRSKNPQNDDSSHDTPSAP